MLRSLSKTRQKLNSDFQYHWRIATKVTPQIKAKNKYKKGQHSPGGAKDFFHTLSGTRVKLLPLWVLWYNRSLPHRAFGVLLASSSWLNSRRVYKKAGLSKKSFALRTLLLSRFFMTTTTAFHLSRKAWLFFKTASTTLCQKIPKILNLRDVLSRLYTDFFIFSLPIFLKHCIWFTYIFALHLVCF